MSEEPEPTRYLSTDDILAIHELIVESNEDTEAGVSSPGDVEYTVESVQEGHFGRAPGSIHETAYQLLRLLAANHPFVDGNKRTALMSVRIFYALNGFEFDYDRQIKEILKALATDETSVESDTVISYFQDHTEPLPPEYQATISLWLAQVEGRDHLSTDVVLEQDESEDDEPNDYDASTRTEE